MYTDQYTEWKLNFIGTSLAAREYKRETGDLKEITELLRGGAISGCKVHNGVT